MSLVQQLLTIAFAASANFLTRVVPFASFNGAIKRHAISKD